MANDTTLNPQKTGLKENSVAARLLLTLKTKIPIIGRQHIDAKIALKTETTITEILFIPYPLNIKRANFSISYLNVYANEL